MLSITCDNASNNNVMVDKLEDLLPDFGGTASHTRCFLHTVNLIAKSLLREFDVTKKNAVAALDNVADDEESELVGLSADDERGESDMAMPGEYYDIEEEYSLDNEEGWVDEVALLAEDEQIELQRNIRPVKLVLLKVR
jgi:hypothetical protein